jgi:tape measure domain-containing protein
MGLLNEMTVRYAVDLSALQSGNASAKNDIIGVGQAATTASDLITEGFTGAGDAVSGFAEMSQMAAENAAEALALPVDSLEELQGAAEEAASGVGNSMESVTPAVDDLGSAFDSLTINITNDISIIDEQVAGMAANTEEASSTINDSTSSAGGGFTGMLGSVGMAVMGFQGLTNMAGQLASGLLGPAASAETVDSSLTNLLGSTKAANSMLGNLNTLASDSPFETLDIDDAAEQLIGFKQKAGDVTGEITALGDALGGVGRDTPAQLNSVVDIIGKIGVNGKITQAEITEFGVHGIDALGAIAKGAGKSTDAIKQMISQGTLPAQQAIDDLTAGIEKNPMLAGGMARAAGTFSGELSTVKSDFDQVLASFGSPILKDLEPDLAGIGDALTSPGFKDFAGSVGAGIASAFGNIAKAAKSVDFKAIGQDVQKLGNWFSASLQPALQQAEPSFSSLATTVGKLASSVLPPLLTAVGNLVPKVVTLAGDISGGLSTAITAISGSFNTWGPIVGTVAAIMTIAFIPAIINSGVQSAIASGKMAAGYIMNIIKTGADGWTAAGQLGSYVVQLIATGAQAAWAGIQIASKFVAGLVVSGAQAAWAGLQIAGKFVVGLVQAGIEAGTTAVAFVANLIPSIVSFAAESLAAAATAIPGLIGGLIGAAGAAWTFTVALLANPITWIVIGIIALIGVIILLATHWGQVTAFVGTQMSRFGGFVHGAMNAAGQDFSALGSKVHSIVDDVGGAFSGLGSKVHSIWDGISSGIKSAINDIIGGIDTFIGGINAIHISIPAINVGPVHTPAFNMSLPAIPQIPYLASGGQVGPGAFIAGENGPELISTRGGANVLNRSQTAALSGPQEVHIHVHLDSQEIAHYTAEPTAREVVAKLFGHGPVRQAA